MFMRVNIINISPSWSLSSRQVQGDTDYMQSFVNVWLFLESADAIVYPNGKQVRQICFRTP